MTETLRQLRDRVADLRDRTLQDIGHDGPHGAQVDVVLRGFAGQLDALLPPSRRVYGRKARHDGETDTTTKETPP